MSAVSSAPTTPVKTGIGHDNYRQLVCHEVCVFIQSIFKRINILQVDKIYSMRTHRNGSRSFLCGWRHTWVNERDLPMGSLELRDRFVVSVVLVILKIFLFSPDANGTEIGYPEHHGQHQHYGL